MENLFILVPLLSVYFLIVASGCAESPELRAPKRCQILYYGCMLCTVLLLLTMFVVALFSFSDPEFYMIAWSSFWFCNVSATIVALSGLVEIRKKRDAKLKKFEAKFAVVFLFAAIFVQFVYFIYWLIVE